MVIIELPVFLRQTHASQDLPLAEEDLKLLSGMCVLKSVIMAYQA